jgi:hypothetical protein
VDRDYEKWDSTELQLSVGVLGAGKEPEFDDAE